MGGYGLIGERLGHSYSPMMHALLGSYEYALYPMPEKDVPGFMKSNDLDGFNVTIPYKTTVMPYLGRISDEARRIGSVNTVVRMPDGNLAGYNTDYYGFSRMLGDAARFTGKKALVLGSGGAAKTVKTVLGDIGCAPIIVVSRNGPENYGNIERHKDAHLIVNATPVGMYPDVDLSPVDLSVFDNLELALDLIYNPARTRFIMQAEALGIPCRNGLTMLAAQAQKASELFGCRNSESDEVENLVRAASRQTRSVALIGMPGCGKTTIGRHISELTGRRFFDTDEMIEREINIPIPEYFALRGEAAFRALESRMLAIAAKETGAVIATGGGIVTVPGNRALLRQNCAAVYVKRPLEALNCGGRPLSLARGVENIYGQRKSLYEKWGEYVYNNDMDALETARAITRDIC